mgnify:CR=1 FL=1
MRAQLTHSLTYRYGAPVTLGEHRLCLRPRGQGNQSLIQHQLQISPDPSPVSYTHLTLPTMS